MDKAIAQVVDPIVEFAHDSKFLVRKMSKPDAKEFQKIAIATLVGFAIMGFIGMAVKLVFMPINNLVLGI